MVEASQLHFTKRDYGRHCSREHTGRLCEGLVFMNLAHLGHQAWTMARTPEGQPGWDGLNSEE